MSAFTKPKRSSKRTVNALMETGVATNHCPGNSKTLTLPRTADVPANIGPGEVFYFDIYNDGYAGPDSDALAFTGEVATINHDAVVELDRKPYGNTFRFMALDFSIEFANTVTVQAFDRWGGMKFNTVVNLAGNHLAVRILRQGATIFGGFLNVVALLPNGEPNIAMVRMTFQGSIQNQQISLWSVLLNGCTRQSFGGPGNFISAPSGSKDNGFKLAAAVIDLESWLQSDPVLGALLQTAVDAIKAKSNQFDNADPNWVYSTVPTDDESQLTIWLKDNQANIQSLLQDIRPLVTVFEETVLQSGIPMRHRRKARRLLDAVFSAIADVGKSLLETGNTYLTKTVLSTGFDPLRRYCDTTADCLVEDFICCRCKCRRPAECRYLDAQETLKQCIDMQIENALVLIGPAVHTASDALCDELDGIFNGQVPQDDLEWAKFIAWFTNVPFPGSSLPGKPVPAPLEALTSFLCTEMALVHHDLQASREKIRYLTNLLITKGDLTNLNSTPLINRVLELYHQADLAILETTKCYMEYACDTFFYVPPTPIPQ